MKRASLALFLLILAVGIALAENNATNNSSSPSNGNISKNESNSVPASTIPTTSTPTVPPTQTPSPSPTQTPTASAVITPIPTSTTPVKEEKTSPIDLLSLGLGLGVGLIVGLVIGYFVMPNLLDSSSSAGGISFRRKERVKEKTVEVEVQDSETENAISGAEVEIIYGDYKIKGITNKKGICKVKVPEFLDSATIFVKKEGYKTHEEDTGLSKRVTVKMKPEKYKLSIKVLDDNGRPIDNAVVKVEGIGEETTDSTGIAVFNLRKGEYKIRVSKGDFHPIEKILVLTKDEALKIPLSKRVGTIIFEVKDKFGYLEGVEIEVGGYKAITDSNGYAKLTLPVGSYTTYIRDSLGVYGGSENPVDVKEGEQKIYIEMKTPSNEIRAFVFNSIESAMNDFEGTVKKQIPSETYDQEIVRYFEVLGRGLKMLGVELKNNVGILRRRYGSRESVLRYFEEVNILASGVVRSMKDILTSREGLYLLYDIKRFRGEILESMVDLDEKMGEIIDKALELELKGITKETVERLGLEVDMEITEAMSEGINGYFFSSLYKVYRGLSVKQAYVVPFLLLSTIKLMLRTHSIRDKLKGLTG